MASNIKTNKLSSEDDLNTAIEIYYDAIKAAAEKGFTVCEEVNKKYPERSLPSCKEMVNAMH